MIFGVIAVDKILVDVVSELKRKGKKGAAHLEC